MIRAPLASTVTLLGALLFAGSANAAICDVEVDPNFPLYMVTVDGEAFKNKRYVDPSDALNLRDVLVSSGVCTRNNRLQQCSVRRSAAGKFVVYRGNVNFDPLAIFNDNANARRHARQMASNHLCAFN